VFVGTFQHLGLTFQPYDSTTVVIPLLGQGKGYSARAATELEYAFGPQMSDESEIKAYIFLIAKMFEVVLIWVTVDLRQRKFSWRPGFSCLTLYSVSWKPYDETRSMPQFALNLNGPAVRFHHFLGDPETHPQTLDLRKLFDSLERFKNALQILVRYADPMVSHYQQNMIGIR